MNNILLGDCIDQLKTLEPNSIDAIVTDPPYGLSFMGKKWDYDVPSKELWEQCLRVLKPGGYLLSFAGTRTQHRMAVNIEDAGFEIRDMIAWVYGSGFPKSLNIGKAVDKLQGNEREEFVNTNGSATGSIVTTGTGSLKKEFIDSKGNSEWEGWGTALKPALEPITVARKPLSEKTVAENVLKWGTGGINIDGSRVEYTDGTTPEQILGKYTGSNVGKDSPTNHFGVKEIKSTNTESTLQGRFPANLIHDGSDEVVSLFPDSKSVKSNRGNINIGQMAGGSGSVEGTDTIRGHTDSGSAARFFYCAKASKADRDEGLNDFEEKGVHRYGAGIGEEKHPELPAMNKNYHPTVKPTKLMQYLVKLVTPKGGTVLDPFMGSGSTGKACKLDGFDFIGIEREPEYVEIAKARIEAVQSTLL